MSLQKLELVGLRGFAIPQELPFAIPNGSPGSGLTTLVGPNNGGKSTVVEALRALAAGSPHNPSQPQSFTEGRRNKHAEERVNIQAIDVNGSVGGLRTIESGEVKLNGFRPEDMCQYSPCLLGDTSKPFFSKGEVTRGSYVASYGSLPTRGAALDQFGFRLFQVQGQARAKFDDLLGKVIRPVPNWTIDQSDQGQYYLKVEKSGLYHSSEGMGDGLVSLLFIINALYDSTPGDMIVVDEPELSLHPSLQRRLFDLFNEYTADRQIVISTHSPYFVSFDALLNGARIARLHLEDDSSVISTLSESPVKRLESFNNYNNPHVLGLDAREAFFLDDGVILVEGQEDVVFYQRIADQLGTRIEGSFFGWGVGGADNMRTIAALLSELEFKKVVGLLDGDRASLLPKLREEFPQYQFHNIPADDIRTKPSTQPRPAVSGIRDESGRVRPEYIEPMKELLIRLN